MPVKKKKKTPESIRDIDCHSNLNFTQYFPHKSASTNIKTNYICHAAMDPGFYVGVVFTQTALLKHYYSQITPPIWQWQFGVNDIKE